MFSIYGVFVGGETVGVETALVSKVAYSEKWKVPVVDELEYVGGIAPKVYG
jgi:hypothetical protein